MTKQENKHVMKSTSLATKLLLGFFAIIVLGGMLGGLGIAKLVRGVMEKEISQKLSLFSEHAIDSVDRIIYFRIETMRAFASEIADHQAFVDSRAFMSALGDTETIQSYIDEQDLLWRAAGDQETSYILDLIDSDLSQKIKANLEQSAHYNSVYEHQLFDEVFITNSYGVNIAQSQKTTDYYQADEEWWQVARERGVFVSDPEFDDSAGTYAMELAVPVYSDTGDFLGVIKALLNIGDIIDSADGLAIKQKAFGESASMNILTAQGDVVYSSAGEYEFLYNIRDTSFWKQIEEHKQVHDHAENATRAAEPPFFIVSNDDFSSGEAFTVYAHSEGYQDFSGLGWVLMYRQDAGELLESVQKVVLAIYAIVLAVVITLMIIGYVFFRQSIIKPILAITQVAESISAGNLEARARVAGTDELSSLGRTFNMMTEKLHQHNRELEQQVTARTKDLSAAKKDLEAKVAELENVNKLMIGREVKMSELKEQLGQHSDDG